MGAQRLETPVRVFHVRRAGALEVDKLVEPALSHAMLGHKGSGRLLLHITENRDGEEAEGGRKKKFRLNLAEKLST